MTFDANDAATGVDGIRREILTWDEFGDAARALAGDVLRSGFRPDVVIAIARGGLLLAGAISYALGTKACGSINVSSTPASTSGCPSRCCIRRCSTRRPRRQARAARRRRIRLGRTLAKVVAIIRDEGAEVRTATLYTKSHTVLEPDFDYRRTDDWIVFPGRRSRPSTPRRAPRERAPRRRRVAGGARRRRAYAAFLAEARARAAAAGRTGPASRSSPCATATRPTTPSGSWRRSLRPARSRPGRHRGRA